jgi:membrane protease YdiL (CAAX protease family)
MSAPTVAPPDWYPDPTEAGGPLRYWDGTQWTAWQSRAGVVTVVPLWFHVSPAAEPVPDDRAPWPGPAVGVVLLAMIGSTLLAVAFAALGRLADLDSLAARLVLSSLGLYLGLIASCSIVQERWGTKEGFRSDFGLRYEKGDWWRGLLASFAARAAGVGVMVFIVLFFWRHLDGSSVQQIGEPEQFGSFTLVVFAIVALVAAPFVEELFFRGLLQRSLETVVPPWAAIGIQGGLFGLAHITVGLGVANVLIVVPVAVAGTGFGYLAFRYKRLAPGMAAHAFFNLVPVVILSVQVLSR